MAIPTTGNLAILSCPGGVNCTSITGVICGTAATSSPQSVCNLLQQAGLSIPNSISNLRGSTIGDLSITPSTIINIPAAGTTCCVCAFSACPNHFTQTSSQGTWLHASACCIPSPISPGAVVPATIDANTGAARSGYITYNPNNCGATICTCFCQLAGAVPKPVSLIASTSVGCGTSSTAYAYLHPQSTIAAGECYCICLRGTLGTVSQAAGSCAFLKVSCGGTQCYCCCIPYNVCSTSLNYSMTVTSANQSSWCICIYAHTSNTSCPLYSNACAYIYSVTAISGLFCVGSPSGCKMYTL